MAIDPKRRPPENGEANTGAQGQHRGSDTRRSAAIERTADGYDRALPNADTITEAQS